MNRQLRRPTVRVVIVVMAALIAMVIAAGVVLGGLNPGPQQPVPFSHRIHVQTKQLSCFFCHPSGLKSSNAGIPPVEKCLLCHKVIASNFRPIANLLGYYGRDEPVPWVRVARVPDFVHFSHEPHLARGFDCGGCHGNVAAVDRVKLVHRFDMGFCVNCHWKNRFSVSCFICHY